MRGIIICNRCRKKMDGVCKCKSLAKGRKKPLKPNTKCLIQVYWKGKHYEYRRDDQGYVFTYEKAKDKLSEISTAIKKGLYSPLDWTDAKVKERRFDNQYQLYRKEKEEQLKGGEISPEYYRITILSIHHNYLSFFDAYDVREIDRAALADFKLKRLNALAKIKSKKNVLNALHAFFTWLYENGQVTVIPPFPSIKGEDATPRRAIRPEVQAEGLANIPGEYRDPINFMMRTGLRPGECVALLVKSVDISNRVVWVERALSGSTYIERTKNKTKLPIPLNDTALEIAQRNVHDKFPMDFLFINPRTGRGYARKALWSIWRNYSGTDVRLYEATRHSYCTQIVPLTDPFTAQRLMRHKDRRSTDNYYHAYSETLLDVVQRMDNVRSLPEKNRSEIEATSKNTTN